jgi:hypothetical protein
MFSFQTKAEIGSKEVSNVEIDEAWGIFTLKLLANWSLWSPTHRLVGYWASIVVNDNAMINMSNPQMMWCVVCHLFNWNMMPKGNIKDSWVILWSMVQVLWKNTFILNIQICITNGGPFVAKGCNY